jgi:hypothetical protein
VLRRRGTATCDLWIAGTGCADEFQNIEVAWATVPAPGEYAVFVAPGHCDGSGFFDGLPPCGTMNEYYVAIECTRTCLGDTDRNGAVDVDDLVNVIMDWDTDGLTHHGDVNGSGQVDVEDLGVVIVNWGACPS